ncbi:Nif3-like dinuclear metal center hexameric protein [Paenibacillus sp. YN15]|uniref:Nif3-like dinuclear metal center hexameric protein n=1 Tax=Paenibacillus sp. YN15 TaxID=1742774 RepID=UPI000DCEE74B|nr:Nif3-like dinuclear metal center hexameric protein [Paenibacillus sp. YN15]RAU92597.1 transcriptional regulator [Paenibacillus sp. YN15]
MTTVQEIIDKLLQPVQLRDRTTDRLIVGDPGKRVSRIAVAFSPAYATLEQAAAWNADLLIVHEPVFYSHYDETDWLAGDRVFENKLRLIQTSDLAIYRFHDYLHDYRPDGILAGLLQALDWQQYADPKHPHVIRIPPVPAERLAAELKQKLGLARIQYYGRPDQQIATVCLSPGMEGGKRQIGKLREHQADLLLVGETHSWETDEYIQDAAAMGMAKSMMLLGHRTSEEAGMRRGADWLAPLFPSLSVRFFAGCSMDIWL